MNEIECTGGAIVNFNTLNTTPLSHKATGFLYGLSEPNVPTIDLLAALKPGFIVQKVPNGLQHPTGDLYVHPYNTDLVERYAQIVFNDNQPETVYFRNTLSWDMIKNVVIYVELYKGKNIIKIYNDNSYQISKLVNSVAPRFEKFIITNVI